MMLDRTPRAGLRRERDALKKLLRERGSHAYECKLISTTSCSCGLRDALAEGAEL